MDEWINDVWQVHQNSWGDHQRLSLADFVKLVQTYLTLIQEVRDGLLSVQVQFNGWQTIQPDQCNEAIGLIQTMDKPLADYTRFLEQKAQLPLSLFSLRYPVMVELACAKEHLWMILALLGRYRSLCRNASNEAAKHRLKILDRLEALLQDCEDILRLSQVMFDQAHFQEHREDISYSTALFFV
jgi:hypothetical protein